MSAESKLWVQPEAGAFRLYASLGAAREHVATFKREVDANQACERINGWQQLQVNNQAWQTELRIAKEQRDLLLAALKRCKAAAEDSNRLPSARLELVRDYATPLIVAAEGGVQ